MSSDVSAKERVAINTQYFDAIFSLVPASMLAQVARAQEEQDTVVSKYYKVCCLPYTLFLGPVLGDLATENNRTTTRAQGSTGYMYGLTLFLLSKYTDHSKQTPASFLGPSRSLTSPSSYASGSPLSILPSYILHS